MLSIPTAFFVFIIITFKNGITIFVPKNQIMGLLTPKGKKGDKKNNSTKNNPQQSKFIGKGGSKPAGFAKKQMPGSANRGS